jgi:hypothetical protein
MRIDIFVLIVMVLFAGSTATAQKEKNIWYFGTGAGIDFNSGSPVVLNDGKIVSRAGCASIADRTTGKLLFYTNGDSVWNRMHQLMPNGRGLKGRWNSTQSALIVPMPGNATRYYVFTSDAASYGGHLNDGIFYSIIDMTLDNGFGDVTVRANPLIAPAAEKLTAVKSCDGNYWVIVRGPETLFYSFKITPSGVSQYPVVSGTGRSIGLLDVDGPAGIGYMKASPDGSKLATMDPYSPPLPNSTWVSSYVQVYDFDIVTGRVSNGIPILIQDENVLSNYFGYGVSFSPDNTKLYAAFGQHRLYQFDATRRDSLSMAASKTLLSKNLSSVHLTACQLAPDGKVYIGTFGSHYLSVIDNPNAPAAECSFREGALFLEDGTSWRGLPNMIDADGSGYARAGSDITICQGDSAELTAMGGKTYQWSPESALPCVACSTMTIAPESTTAYTVKITTASGCEFVDTVVVKVLPKPAIVTSGDVSICRGNPVTLSVSGADRYEWQPSTGLNCSDCPAPVASPESTTVYTVIGTNDNGCRDSATVTIHVQDSLKVDAGPDMTICAGDSLQLSGIGGTTFEWSPTDGLSCSNCPNPVSRPKVTTVYTLRSSSGVGCSGVDSVIVTVKDSLPNVDAGTAQAICLGGSIRLEGWSDATTWHWSPAESLSCTDCQSPTASPRSTTVYTLSVTNASGCTSSDTVSVTVLPIPSIDAGADVTICTGDSAQLKATGATIYHWNPVTGLSCVDCANPVARPIVTTMYRVTTVGANGCSASDSVLVTVIGAGSVDAGPSQTICRGDSVHLQASDGAAWQWNPLAGLSCTDCRSPIAYPSATTLYTVTVSAAGCSASDTVSITVFDAPVISAGPDVSICSGGTAQLHASGGVSYQWSPAEGLSCTDCADPIASPKATTVYHVTGRGVQGCQATDTLRVEVGSQQTLRGHIGRDYRVFPGTPLRVPVVLDEAITAPGIDTMVIDLSYGVNILRLNGVDLSGGILNGWKLEPLNVMMGNYRARVISPVGVEAQGSGTLLTLDMAAFLGDSLASELPMHVDLVGSECQRVEISPGRVALDSVCGMTLRLVRISADKYSLSQNDPNPFNPSTRIAFSLAFDGPARLEIFDAVGTRVAVLIEEAMAAGSYEAVWDAGNAASGVYYYRLTSGTWSATRRMVVVK